MKTRKLISVLLVCVLIFSLTSSAFASNSTYLSVNPDIQNQMLRILASTEAEKENYGLADLDYSAVHLGNEIPTYKVSDGTLIQADIRLIPITDGTNLISFFYIANDDNGNAIVQLSNELVAPLLKYVNGESFAIVYDDDGAYVCVNNSLYLLGLKEQSIFTTEDILRHNALCSNQYPEGATMEEDQSTRNLVSLLDSDCFTGLVSNVYATTVQTTSLDVSSFIESLQSPAFTTATSKYLSVEKISQPSNTSICWAIAITSIANYVWNGNWTYTDIVQMFASGVDKGMYTEDVIYNLNYYFGVDWGYTYTTTLAPSVILSYLIDNYPLYADFTRSNGAHAVVIRGVSTSLNTFSVMNPTPSTTGYTSGTISSNNTLTFVSGYSGVTYTLRSFGFPVELS